MRCIFKKKFTRILLRLQRIARDDEIIYRESVIKEVAKQYVYRVTILLINASIVNYVKSKVDDHGQSDDDILLVKEFD